MELQHPVHPALAGLVASIQGYDHRLDPAAVHHGVPSPTATVILSFDEPLDVGWTTRYSTLGFNDNAALDDGDMWPAGFAVQKMTPAVKKQVVELVTLAAGRQGS